MKRIITGILLLISVQAFAQSTEYTHENYIAKYKDDAIREMFRSGVPASITLAQGLLESARGASSLAQNAKNHFGIKCHTVWEGPTYYQDDDEKALELVDQVLKKSPNDARAKLLKANLLFKQNNNK